MTKDDIAQKIERLVRDHLEEVRAEAAAAMARAFASATKSTTSRAREKRAVAQRREPAVVAELAERLHAAVMAEPGESMTVYSNRLGAGVRELHRPMTMLKRAGRLRSTGNRRNTHYFPMPGS